MHIHECQQAPSCHLNSEAFIWSKVWKCGCVRQSNEIHDLENFLNKCYFIECSSIWVCHCFLIIRLRLSFSGKNTRKEVMLCPQFILSGSIQDVMCHLVKVVSPGFSSIIKLPFLIKNIFWRRYFEPIKIFCFSLCFHPLILASIDWFLPATSNCVVFA